MILAYYSVASRTAHEGPWPPCGWLSLFFSMVQWLAIPQAHWSLQDTYTLDILRLFHHCWPLLLVLRLPLPILHSKLFQIIIYLIHPFLTRSSLCSPPPQTQLYNPFGTSILSHPMNMPQSTKLLAPNLFNYAWPVKNAYWFLVSSYPPYTIVPHWPIYLPQNLYFPYPEWLHFSCQLTLSHFARN